MKMTSEPEVIADLRAWVSEYAAPEQRMTLGEDHAQREVRYSTWVGMLAAYDAIVAERDAAVRERDKYAHIVSAIREGGTDDVRIAVRDGIRLLTRKKYTLCDAGLIIDDAYRAALVNANHPEMPERSTRVTDEMVERVARALHEESENPIRGDARIPWWDASPYWHDKMRRMARVALEGPRDQ